MEGLYIIVGIFIESHKPWAHPMVFPLLKCSPIHAKASLSEIKELVGSRVTEASNKHVFSKLSL